MTQPPNVVIVVLDCVRANEFPDGTSPIEGLDFLNTLKGSCLRFTRAVSPSSWSIPSHATLLTGRQPWEHHAHGKGNLRLDPSVPRLSTQLKSQGYNSALLSANPLIGHEYGLGLGFDYTESASPFDSYLRFRRKARSKIRAMPRPDGEVSGATEFFRAASLVACHGLSRVPWSFDVTAQMGRFLRNEPRSPLPPPVSPWIEPTLSDWVSAQPRGSPLFAFVNLIDAHEPYLAMPGGGSSLRDWWNLARTRQDLFGWATGRWSPTASERSNLKQLYANSLRRLDLRLKRIVRILQETDRWDDTLFIVTSDHGQALGERDLLFHGLRVDESVIRIPLWVKSPHGASVGEVSDRWVSLADVTAEVLKTAGVEASHFTSGTPLTAPVLAPQGPACSVSDGVVFWDIANGVPEARRKELDHVIGAAYHESLKATVDVTDGRHRLFDIVADPEERRNIFDPSIPTHAHLAERARTVATSVRDSSRTERDFSIDERLSAWGYL